MAARRDNYAVAPFAASQYQLGQPFLNDGFSRKAQMQPALKLFAGAALLVMTGLAHAEEPRIGFVAPLTGSSVLLGKQMLDGAALAAAQADAELIGADDECSAEGGEAAARKLVEANVAIVVGFLCTEAIEAALPVLKEANVPVITPGVRANGLTDRRIRTGWPVWRLAPRADAEAGAVAEILSHRWRTEHFAIIDDGTLYARELAEALRLAVELAGLRPVLVDTFRPQMENQIGLAGRLARAGATHVFVGGDRDDIAVMARDAASRDHNLVFAGGEALRAAGEIPLAEGTLMVGLPEWAELMDEGVSERFAGAGIIPDGYVAPAFAAVEIALQAVQRAKTSGAALADSLDGGPFDTVIGMIAFDANGDLAHNPFILQRYDGARFLPVE